MLLNWSDEVFDIREHFPLHTFRECMRIADRIGVTYPLDPVTGHPLVLSGDVSANCPNRERASPEGSHSNSLCPRKTAQARSQLVVH